MGNPRETTTHYLLSLSTFTFSAYLREVIMKMDWRGGRGDSRSVELAKMQVDRYLSAKVTSSSPELPIPVQVGTLILQPHTIN